MAKRKRTSSGGKPAAKKPAPEAVEEKKPSPVENQEEKEKTEAADKKPVAVKVEKDMPPYEWYPSLEPAPRGLILYNRLYLCCCGMEVTPNHVSQCKAAMQHWAFTRAAWVEYEKAKKRVTRNPIGGIQVEEGDFPPFQQPKLLREQHFYQYGDLFPRPVKSNHPQALEVATEIIKWEETRYWADLPTHRAIVENALKKFGDEVPPQEWQVSSADWEFPRRRQDRVVQLPPAWVPRDRYVAQAVRQAHIRLNKPFSALANNVVQAAGRNRGMVETVTVGEEMVGRLGRVFLKWALLEDKKAREQQAATGGLGPVAYWVPPEAREANEALVVEIEEEAVKEEAAAFDLLNKPVGPSGGSPQAEASTKARVKREYLEIGSSDEEGQKPKAAAPVAAAAGAQGEQQEGEEDEEEEEEQTADTGTIRTRRSSSK